MSIRALALELYKAQQKVEQITKKIETVTLVAEKNSLAQDLRIARNELNMLRKILDGEKETGSFRKRFEGFGKSGNI